MTDAPITIEVEADRDDEAAIADERAAEGHSIGYTIHSSLCLQHSPGGGTLCTCIFNQLLLHWPTTTTTRAATADTQKEADIFTTVTVRYFA